MHSRLSLGVVLTVSALSIVTPGANGRKFYPDDPVSRDPETQDASAISELRQSEQYDFVENSFFDAGGQLYFIKFDPPSNPEMASGAEVIATKFFHAFGYHVPENYVAHIRREDLVIGEGADVEEKDGTEHGMKPRDLDLLLKKAAR